MQKLICYVIYVPMQHLLISIFLSLHLFFSLSLPPKTKTKTLSSSFSPNLYLSGYCLLLPSPKCPFLSWKSVVWWGSFCNMPLLEAKYLGGASGCFLDAICIIVSIGDCFNFEGPTLLLSPYNSSLDDNQHYFSSYT